MEQTKLDRINELARLSKERELSESEKSEQQKLRKEYIEEWRRSTVALLDSLRVQDEKGNIVPLKKKGS